MKSIAHKNYPPWFGWAVLLLGLNCFGALYTLVLGSEYYFYEPPQTAMTATPAGTTSVFPWQSTLQIHLIRWNTWILFVPFIVQLARKYRFETGRIAVGALGVHCLASVVIPVLHFVFMSNIAYLLGHPETITNFHTHTLWWMILRFFVTAYGFMLSAGLYWLWVAGVHTQDYYRRYRKQELRASQLEVQLATARLDALKAQLHPHFLFNTLNSISALLYKDVEMADTMLARLGDFLRMTLESAGGQFVTLRQEFDFVRCYLDIETLRFQDRITSELVLPADLYDAAVPNMLLQPLVENAVHHGFASSERHEKGVITVRAWQEDTHSLTIEVCDTGSGFDGSEFREGIGLGNTRARITKLYGLSGAFGIKSYRQNNSPNDSLRQGTQVRITIPLRRVDIGDRHTVKENTVKGNTSAPLFGESIFSDKIL